MTNLLAGLVRALLEGALSFLAQRLDRAKADKAQREAAVRETEAAGYDRFAQQARQAVELRNGAPGNDPELDSFLRAPADRDKKRAD